MFLAAHQCIARGVEHCVPRQSLASNVSEPLRLLALLKPIAEWTSTAEHHLKWWGNHDRSRDDWADPEPMLIKSTFQVFYWAGSHSA